VSLTLASPAALWLFLLVPLVWLGARAARTRFNSRQRLVQTLVRSLLLAAIALALARPVVSTSTSRQSVVYLVDVSHSVASRAIGEAADTIDAVNGALRPAHSRTVAFARSAVPLGNTAALRTLAGETGADHEIDRTGTDLETALLAARAELAPEHVPHIVLFSDGQPTAGDDRGALARLADAGIPVSVDPLAGRVIGDTWIESMSVPPRIGARTPFAAVVHVGSHRDVAATIELRSAGASLISRVVELRAGVTPVTLEAVVASPGTHLVEGVLTVPDDAMAANNTLVSDTWADAPARVLYVEGALESAKYLSGALTAAGFDVAVRPPAGVPATRDGFEPWDVVILSDVERQALPEGAMDALAEWVEAEGGGLLVAGGERVFGDRGYRHTPLERIVPVTFERRDEPDVALVIVLDRSWSMAGASMELTKTAAVAAVDVLGDEQLVGILTFNDKFDWDVPIRNVGEHRAAIREKIAAIGPGGHTLIYPAIEQAYVALRTAKARARHVILLSDGRSYPGDYEGLVRRMADARITLSTVAVGPSADPDLLRDLAEWGNGRAYVVADATAVPEIFVKEAKNAATPAFDEKAIAPVLRAPAFLNGVDLARLPPLGGRTATVLKEGALELLATDEDDPLLAFWPVGLGRTAMFTSDVKDRWAADWVRWPGYGPFFASIVRALQRQRTPPVSLEVAAGPIRGATRAVSIAVEAREPDGQYRNLSNPTVRVQAGSSVPVPAATRQVAPGRYEATLVTSATQPVTVTVENAAPGGVTSRTLAPDPAAEYRFGGGDEARLRAMAAASGGTWRPSASDLEAAAASSRPRRHLLSPALSMLALLLWGADLALRRVRIFETRAADQSSRAPVAPYDPQSP